MPEKAKREKLKSAIYLHSASGGGKTLSALMLAYGMMKEMYPDLTEEEIWDKIGLVDTEQRSSNLYVNTTAPDGTRIGQFWMENLHEPFTIERYGQAVQGLKKVGCEVVIIDSFTHAWEGEGGILEKQSKAGGRYQDWKVVKPDLQAQIKMILDPTVHIIATARAKTEYAMTRDETGKMEVQKFGLKPVQKQELEYEFQVVFHINMEHKAEAMKDRSFLYGDRGQFFITAEDGRNLAKWLEKGIDLQAERKKEMEDKIAFIRATTTSDSKGEALWNKYVIVFNKRLGTGWKLEDLDYPTLDQVYRKFKEL